MNISVNDRFYAMIQDEKEKKFRDNLFAEINKDISDEEDRKYIYSLYFQFMTQQVSQFSRNDKDKSDFFKELSGNELYSKNLLWVLKILCEIHKAYGEDKNDQWKLNQLVHVLSKKTSKAFFKLLREFTPVKQPLYTVTNENNEQIQYCTIELESMSAVHSDQNEIIMNSSENTCETGAVFQKSLDRIRKNVNNLSSSYSEIKKLQLHIDEYELTEAIRETDNYVKIVKNVLKKREDALSANPNMSQTDIDGVRDMIVCLEEQTGSKFWNACKKQFKLNVFNMCIRGKGSSDTSRIDREQSNNILCRLNRDLNGDDKLKISNYGDVNFLFDQVSKSKNSDFEPYDYMDSVLNDNGKQITERVLGLLLPSDYEIECQNGKILVNRSNCSQYKIIADNIDNNVKQDNLSLSDILDTWVEELFPNGCSDLPDDELKFRKKLEQDTDSYKKVRDEFKKTCKISVDISKDMFDDMFATILYRYTEAIHMSKDKPHPDKNHFLRELRRSFGGYEDDGEIERYPINTVIQYAAGYFRYIEELRQGVGPSEIYNLPINFFKYNENDPDKMYSPLNYIQVLIQTIAVLMPIDSADKETRKIFNRSTNKLVWMLESKGNKAKKYYQNLQAKINEYVSTHSDIKKQEVLVGLLCKGIKNFTKTKCQAICNMAHQITEFDLDNPMRQHATQLNFVRAKKDTNGELIGCELNENGALSVKVNLTERLSEAENLFIIKELVTCETQAEIKAKLDNFNWHNLSGAIDAEQFLEKLDNKVMLDDVMYRNEVRPLLWSKRKCVKYLFSKSYSMKCAKWCTKFWVFTVDSTDLIHAFHWGFLRALIERVIAFFPCVFFLMLALIIYPFSRYNTNRIYRFIEQTVRTKLEDKINNIDPDNDHNESKNQKLKQNDLGEQESDDFLKDIDFDLFNVQNLKTDLVVQPIVPLIEPREPIKPEDQAKPASFQPQQEEEK